MKDRSDKPSSDQQSVADQNVERLLAKSYEPEIPDSEFVARVGDRVLDESRRQNKRDEAASDGDRAERPANNRLRPFVHWEMAPWAMVALLLLVIIYLSIPKSNSTPRVFHDDEVVWIDGKAYVAAEAADSEDEESPQFRQIDLSRAEIIPSAPAVRMVGHRGITPRQRAAAEKPEPVAIGSKLETASGERRRVTLPDGSALYIDENSAVDINDARNIRLNRGQVFLEVAPDARNKFVVKTPQRDVTALGTKFAVQVAAAKTAVVVTQGKVVVDGVDTPLQAGQRLDARRQADAPPVVSPAGRASHLLAWTKELMAASRSPLVPGSEYGGGSLVAVDPQGQEAKLSLRDYHVDVHIQDGFARTTIDQTYFNHLSSRLEGTFYFPLPPDASISRLAMYVSGQLMEGGMCERDRARDVFETIKHRALDPALLEWVDGSTFKMRVFPLEGRQEKRIVLSYTQRLENHYGRMQYRFPAGHNMNSVRDWSVNVQLVNGERLKRKCDSHDLTATTRDGDVILNATAKDVQFDTDVVIELREPDSKQQAYFSTVDHDGSRYFMARYRPTLKTKSRRERRDWIFLFDADGSRSPLAAQVQVDIIQTLLENAEHDDQFAIVTAGTRTHAFAAELKPATPKNVTEAITFLQRTHLIGALDLEKAFRACGAYSKAAKNPTLVHVGAGVPILGARETNVLLMKLPSKTQYVGVGVGKRWNRGFMKAAASKTGGYFTQINPDEPTEWRAFELSATLNTPRLLDLRVAADGEKTEFFAFGEGAVHGEQICAVAKIEPGQSLPKTLHLHGSLDGEKFEQTIPVENVKAKAGYLPRFWAKLAIDKMVAENAARHKTQIVELSKAMYVMSPFTSLLVLENEEMYEQYNVDRGRKDHWALYPCPEKIEVIHEPLQGPKPEIVKDEPKKTKAPAKPSGQQVLNTLLVRVGRFGYQSAEPNYVYAFTRDGTRVTVPDGGTVLLGGIRRPADDFGPTQIFGIDPVSAGQMTGDLDLRFVRDGFTTAVPQFGVFNSNGRLLTNSYPVGDLVVPISQDINGNFFDPWRIPSSSLVLNANAALPYDIDNDGDGMPSTIWGDGDLNFNGAANFLAMRLQRDGSQSDFIRPVFLDLAGKVPTTQELRAYYRQNRGWDRGGAAASDFGSLIRLINSTVAPETWDEVGGVGSIENFETNLSLVISQRQTMHDRRRDLAMQNLTTALANTRLASRLMERLDQPGIQSSRARFNSRFAEQTVLMDRLRELRQAKFAEALYQDELSHVPHPDDLWIEYPDAALWEELALKRLKYRSVDLRGSSEEQRIRTALDEDTELSFVETPLQDAIDFLEDRHKIQIELDGKTLDAAGIGRDTPITRELSGISLRSALRLMLRDHELAFTIHDDTLLISTPEIIETKTNRPWTRHTRLSKDRRVLRVWSRRMTERLEHGLKKPSLLYVQPGIASDPRPFRHLLAFTPGMNTSRADVLAVLEQEAEITNSPKVGKIDSQARKLIASARRRGWQSITLPRLGREPVQLRVDGRGRYQFDRITKHGLREQVVCDGSMIWHLYPELGIGAKRTSSRFHRSGVSRLVPWHVRSAEDMATGADLRMIGERTIAIVPHWIADIKSEDDKPLHYPRVHMVFGKDGRLAERQIVEMPTGEVIARTTYAEDGTVRLLDGEAETVSQWKLAVKNTAAPDLTPDVKDLVVLPMPVRNRSHVHQTVKNADQTIDASQQGALKQIAAADRASDDVARWSEEDALRLIAAGHWQDNGEMRNVIARRFFARGDRRIGFYTLLLSSGVHWDVDKAADLGDGTKVDMNPLADHPQHPLAEYIAEKLKPVDEESKQLPRVVKSADDGFVARLSEYQYLQAYWATDQKVSEDAQQLRHDVERLFAFVDRCDSPTFAFGLLRRVQHHLGGKQPFGRIADSLLRLEKQGATSYVTQYELARSLSASGKKKQAQELFLQLYLDTFDKGLLPPIEKDFVKVVKAYKGNFDGQDDAAVSDENNSGDGFDRLAKVMCRRLIDQQRRTAAVSFAWQCRQLGRSTLAKQLIEQIQSGTSARERIPTTLAVLEYFLHDNQYARAETLLASLLENDEFAKQASLWRLGAKISDNANMLARALAYREQAVDLEFRQLDSTVNLAWLRNEYGQLLADYGKLANAVARPDSQSIDELVSQIVKTADQWRSLDNDPTQACQAAAKIFNRLGQRELAWDYLTTPLALKPNEAAPWRDLAHAMRDDEQFELADRAFAAAFEAEPTNAEILWQHAQMLDRVGKSQRALQLYDQLAGGQWQPRFSWVRTQAQQILDRNFVDAAQ